MLKKNMVNKKMIRENLETMIMNNRNVEELLAVVLNNCSDALNAYNPKLTEELQNAKVHLSNMSDFLRILRANAV